MAIRMCKIKKTLTKTGAVFEPIPNNDREPQLCRNRKVLSKNNVLPKWSVPIGCEKMGPAPNRVAENPANSGCREVPLPILSQPLSGQSYERAIIRGRFHIPRGKNPPRKTSKSPRKQPSRIPPVRENPKKPEKNPYRCFGKIQNPREIRVSSRARTEAARKEIHVAKFHALFQARNTRMNREIELLDARTRDAAVSHTSGSWPFDPPLVNHFRVLFVSCSIRRFSRLPRRF